MTLHNTFLSMTLAVGVVAAYATTASAQFIDITAGNLTYTQNFDTLTQSTTVSQFVNGTADATGTLGEGVYAFIGGTVARSTGGTLDDTPIIAGTGSSNAGGLYSLATANTPGDRAFGTLLSGSTDPQFFGFRFQNLTGVAITGFTVSFTGEQYRVGVVNRVGTQDRLDFQYSTTATTVNGTGFTDFDALDFTATTGPTLGATFVSALVGPQTITLDTPLANGGSLFIRFNDFDVSNADDGLAVDNFNFTAIAALPTTVPEANTFALIAPILGVLGVMVARRKLA